MTRMMKIEKMHRISEKVHEPIQALYVSQLLQWPLARDNYHALDDVLRRDIPLGDFPSALQFNPARRRSTAAVVDKKTIEKRPCFLCSANRPEEQIECHLNDDFSILVNPYPIFPLHLTISATTHRPQDRWPLDMVICAEKMPGVVFFFNGARAGASAPDHLHFQATADCELPIIGLIERHHPVSCPGLRYSTDFGLDLPFGFFSFVIPADSSGQQVLAQALNVCGFDPKTGRPDRDLLNVFVWLDPAGLLRIVAIPRKAHRPDCYFIEGDGHHTVSPGAVDMAGLVILPDKEDFDSLTAHELRVIYAQTAFTQDEFKHLYIK